MSLRIESDYKTRIEAQVQIHVRNLIKLMTGFDESDENFGIAYDYITSNLKNHRFLSVDKFRVNREITGLQEKFQIHSQEIKGDLLKKLTERFMKRKLKPHAVDIHYSILQFLLLMSNNPISASLEDDDFGKKYLSKDDSNSNRANNNKNITQSLNSRMVDEGQQLNFIGKQPQLQLQKYDDDDYVFESSSDEEGFEDDEEEEEEDNHDDHEEEQQEYNKEQKDHFSKNSSNLTQGMDVFGLNMGKRIDQIYQKKEGIIKHEQKQNNKSMYDKSLDQSKMASFKHINQSQINQNKDSMLSVTNPHQHHQNNDESNKNMNSNLSAFLGGMATNQSFWNTTQQQSILKNSSLQRRNYEEFLSEQKNEEERQLFLATRQFTNNDLFRDPNSLAQIYENYIKETMNRQSQIQSNLNNTSSAESQISLNHWIYQTKTERQIIQDIILMLQSQPSSTFILVGDTPPEFKLKKKVQVNHLTPSTLENIVDNCIDFANQLLKFQFYRLQYSQINIGTSFQAFLASIQAFYIQFQKYINAFHLVFLHQSAQSKSNIYLTIQQLFSSSNNAFFLYKIVQKKEIKVTLEERYEFLMKKTISLIELFRGLRDYQMEMRMMMNMLEGVIEIFKKSNTNNEFQSITPSNAIEDSNIQAYLACQLQIDSQYYCKLSDLQQLNSQLFLFCIEPYLGILNDWLHGGFFYDKFSEFFIKNNTCNQSQQQKSQQYQHIDHKINWVKDFSIRYHQVNFYSQNYNYGLQKKIIIFKAFLYFDDLRNI